MLSYEEHDYLVWQIKTYEISYNIFCRYKVQKYIFIYKEINHKFKSGYQIQEGQQCVKLKSCFSESFVLKTTESYITQLYNVVINYM